MAYLAVDIGGTKLAAARVSDSGDLEGDVQIEATPAHDGSAAVIASTIMTLRRCGLESAQGVGIAAAGVIDSAVGRVVSSTSSLTGWTGTQVAGQVSAAVGLPVFVLNDGHAFALGESVYGVGRHNDSLLLLAAGTGVAGSYVSGGKPLFGSHWAGSHFGHITVPQAMGLDCYCGGTGHLESIASGSGMLSWYVRRGGDQTVRSARELVERLAHDPLASEAVGLGASAFGVAAGSLVNAFDPAIVVVAGGVTRAGPPWERPMRRAFKSALMPSLEGVPLVKSDAARWPSLRGAACYAMSRMAEM